MSAASSRILMMSCSQGGTRYVISIRYILYHRSDYEADQPKGSAINVLVITTTVSYLASSNIQHIYIVGSTTYQNFDSRPLQTTVGRITGKNMF